jgi:hypothetical protein
MAVRPLRETPIQAIRGSQLAYLLLFDSQKFGTCRNLVIRPMPLASARGVYADPASGRRFESFPEPVEAGFDIASRWPDRFVSFPAFPGVRGQFRFLAFAIEADQDGQRPDLAGSEGKRDMQGEDDPAVAEGKEGPFLSRAQRIVMHVGPPDVASGLARQGVVDSAGQHLGTERQQQLKDAVTEVIEIPAGPAEETMKGAEVFEAAQLPGLNDAGKRAAAGTKNPGAGQCPEGGETGLSKAGLKGEQQRSKGTDQQIGH